MIHVVVKKYLLVTLALCDIDYACCDMSYIGPTSYTSTTTTQMQMQ
jgi:hypothetical protein